MAPVGERDLGRETPDGYYPSCRAYLRYGGRGYGRSERGACPRRRSAASTGAGEQNCIGELRKKTGAIEHQANIEAASRRRQRAQAPRIVAPVMTYRRVKGLNRN